MKSGCGGLSGAALAQSDTRQARIAALGQRITAPGADVLELAEGRLRLLRKEGMGPTAWDTLWAAAAYLAATKQRGPAVEWAARAAECAAFALGEDSAEYEEYAAAAAKGAASAPAGRLKR